MSGFVRVVIAATLTLQSTRLPLDLDRQTKSDFGCRLHERDKLRPYAEMVVRFALALGLATDEVLGLRAAPLASVARIPRRFLRRLEALSQLPKRDQEALLRTIDAFLGLRVKGRAA